MTWKGNNFGAIPWGLSWRTQEFPLPNCFLAIVYLPQTKEQWLVLNYPRDQWKPEATKSKCASCLRVSQVQVRGTLTLSTRLQCDYKTKTHFTLAKLCLEDTDTVSSSAIIVRFSIHWNKNSDSSKTVNDDTHLGKHFTLLLKLNL